MEKLPLLRNGKIDRQAIRDLILKSKEMKFFIRRLRRWTQIVLFPTGAHFTLACAQSNSIRNLFFICVNLRPSADNFFFLHFQSDLRCHLKREIRKELLSADSAQMDAMALGEYGPFTEFRLKKDRLSRRGVEVF